MLPHRPVRPAQRGPAPSGLSHRPAAIPAACGASLDGELVRRRCRPGQGVTVIVPFIEVWIEQMYANVAAGLKSLSTIATDATGPPGLPAGVADGSWDGAPVAGAGVELSST